MKIRRKEKIPNQKTKKQNEKKREKEKKRSYNSLFPPQLVFKIFSFHFNFNLYLIKLTFYLNLY